MDRPASLERKARLIANQALRLRSDADYDFELKIAYMILDALGVTE